MNGIFGKLRRTIAVMLVMAMLMTTVAFAAPGTMTLPSMVKTIEAEAFKGDTSIENVILPDGVTSIGEEAFADCTALSSIVIPDSVEYIGDNAFAGCDGLTIVCSSTSKAAEYAAQYDYLNVQYTDAVEPEFEVEWKQEFTKLYNGAGHFLGMPVVTAEVVGYDAEQHGEIAWSLEQTDGEEIVDLYLTGDESNTAVQYVRFGELGEATGMVSYRMTAAIGSFSEVFDFTVEITDDRTGLPTAVEIYDQVYAVGDTVEFTKGEFFFADGDVAIEDEQVWVEFPGLEENAIWQENGEWTDGGFRVTFTRDGCYTVPAHVFVGNIGLYTEFVVTVGTGAYMEHHYPYDDIYLYEDDSCEDMGLSIVWMENFNGFEYADREWYVELIESSNETPVFDLYIEEFEEVYVGADYKGIGVGTFCAGLTGETGSVTYRIGCIVNGRYDYYVDETFYVLEQPEDSLTDENVILEQDYFEFEVGDTFEFTSDMVTVIGLEDGEYYEIEFFGMEELEAIEGFEYYFGDSASFSSFRVTFDKEGRYVFSVNAKLANNFHIGKVVTVIVGSGVSPDISTDWQQKGTVMYDGGWDLWIGDAYVDNYVALDGAELDWYITYTGNHEDPGIELYVEDAYEYEANCYYAMITARQLNGNLGDYTFNITAEAGDEVLFDQDVTVTLTASEDIAAEIAVETDEYYINEGDEFTFYFTDFDLTEESVYPEDASLVRELDPSGPIHDQESFEWISGGFRVVFENAGLYTFTVRIRINNHPVEKNISVFVGEDPCSYIYEELHTTIVAEPETNHHLGHLYVENLHIRDYEEVEWFVDVVGGEPVAEIYVDNTWDNGRGANVHIQNMSGEGGEFTCLFTAVYNDRHVWQTEVTFYVAGDTEGWPNDEDTYVDQDYYELNVGDTFEFTYDMFHVVGYEPQDYIVGCHEMEEFEAIESFEWTENGFRVTFDKEGRYVFSPAATFAANYTRGCYVTIIVGSGVDPDFNVYSEQISSTMYKGGWDLWIADCYVDNYEAPAGVELEWYVSLTDGQESAPIGLYVEDAYEYDVNCYYAMISAEQLSDESGAATFVVTAEAGDEVVFEKEFTVELIDMPELNVGIWVESTEYFIAPGEEFVFHYSDFGLTEDSELPEGASKVKGIDASGPVWEQDTFEWIDGGFRVVFHEPGRYAFTVQQRVNNFVMEEVVTITVGEGVNISADWDNVLIADTKYDGWFTDLRLESYHLREGEYIDWYIEPAFEEGTPVAELYIGDNWDSGLGVNISARNLTGEAGEATYIVSAYDNYGRWWSEEITVTVVAPEYLPTDDDVQFTPESYQLEPGDTLEVKYDQIGLAEGTLPEGVAWEPEFHGLDENLDAEGVEWLEDGFRVTLNRAGYYSFRAVARIASNYSVERDVIITVGDGGASSAVLENRYNLGDIYPNQPETMHSTWEIVGYNILSTDDVEWKLERYTDEHSPEEPIADLWISWISDQRNAVDVTVGTAREEYAAEEYDLVCVVNGVEIIRERLYANVVEMPENLPTELWVENEVYHVNPGDEFTMGYWMFDLANGEVPEGVEPVKEIHIGGELTDNNHHEWFEDGIRIWPGYDAIYDFNVAVRIGNYYVIKPVKLIVGNGGEQFEIKWDDVAFDMWMHNGDLWVTDAHVNGFEQNYPGDAWIDWRTDLVEHSEHHVVELYVNNTWDENNRSASISARQIGDETGWATYNITGWVGEECIVSREITVYLNHLPEDMPTSDDLWVENTYYELNVGDEFSFTYDMFGLAQNGIDENGWRKEFHDMGELEGLETFNWNENGFTVRFDKDGRYTFHVSMLHNNYYVGRMVSIVVGNGIPENAGIGFHNEIPTLYCGEEYLMDDVGHFFAWLENYTLLEGETVEWSVERVGESVAIDRAYIGYVNDDMSGADIRVSGIYGIGTETFRVTASTSAGFTCSVDFSINVIETPDYLPDDFIVDFAEHYQIGEELIFNNDSISFIGGGDFSADENLRIWHNIEEGALRDENNVYYDEEGSLHVHFWKNNTYEAAITVAIGNYEITKNFIITVGTGVRDDVHIAVDQPTDRTYTDGNDGVWYAYFELCNYNFTGDETVEWTIEFAEGSENNPVELYIDNIGGDHSEGANVHVRNLTDGEGWAKYYVTATTDRYTVTHEIWVNAEHRPEDLPTRIDVGCSEFGFNVGETMYFNVDSWFADGWVPDDAYVVDEIWVDNDRFGDDEVIWNEEHNGFEVTFTRDGRHVFTVAKWLNNICYTADIVVYVGSGIAEGAALEIDQFFTEAYNNEEVGGHYVATANLTNYHPVNEEIFWNMEVIDVQTESGNAPVELRIENVFNDGLSAEILMWNVTGETGSVTYNVTATAHHGIAYENEITFTIIGQPDDMPSEITGVETEVQLEVGETYVFDTSLVGMDREAPEGSTVYFEYFEGMDYLEFLPGFEWLENDSFKVTFNREGQFFLRVGYRINTNRCVFADITITIGEGITAEPGLHVNRLSDTMFADAPAGSEGTMFEIYMNGYEPYEGENMLWEIEHIEGDGCVELDFSDIRDNDCTAQLTARLLDNREGTDTFRVHITTESGWRSFVDYTITTVWPYGNMPGDIWVDDISIPMNEEFVFNPAEYVQMNGEIPEGVKYHYEVEVDELLANAEGFEHIFNGDGGMHDSFRFTPTSENRYQVTVTLNIGNYFSRCRFVLNVGDGIADDVDLIGEQLAYTLFVGGESDMTAVFAELVNYNLMDGEEVRWYLERTDENEFEPCALYMEHDATSCSVRYSVVEYVGSATYALLVETDSGFTDRYEFAINAVEMPGDLPTDVNINIPTHYEVGETMEFVLFESVTFGDGAVYEDAGLRCVLQNINDLPIWYENQSEWTDNGVNITFTQNGRYQFQVVMMMGNYVITRNVDITVGTGVRDDAHISRFAFSDNLLTNQSDGWLGSFYLENYILLEGETVEWTIRPITEDGHQDVANLYLDAEWDGGLGINLSSGWTDDKECGAAYRVTARTGGGFEYFHDFYVNVMNFGGVADGLDGIDIIELDVGQEFEFRADNCAWPNGWVPEEIGTAYSVSVDDMLQWQNFEWLDDSSFRVIPEREGRYWVDVYYHIGNRTIGKTIFIRVGSGIDENLNVDWKQEIDTVYMGSDTDIWLGCGELYGYTTVDGSELDWQLECVDDSNGYPAWLYIDQQGPVCHVRTENLYKTGTITYRLTVYTPEGWSDSHEFTVNVEEMPENLPTALDVESEVYLDVGDTYTFRLEDVEFADGEVPEGASVRVSVPGIDDLDIVRENYFEWHEDGNGFDVTFDHNGRYVFDVCKQVGNHMVYAEVHIYVGTGLDEDAYAFCEQYVYNVYENGGNDVFIGVANVDNYELFTGETVWTLERIDSECTSEAMLYSYVDGGYVELYANTLDNCGTGVIRYNLTADLGGENVWSFPIQVMVDEMPENLPTALAMPEEPMVFTVGDSAEINYQDFGFAEGYVPEDAFVRSWLIGIEDTDLWHCNEVSYDVQNMYINFFSAGEYVVEVTRTINNYAVKGELTIIVNEPEIFVEAYQAYNTLYLGADETGNADTWVADAYLQNLWLEEGEAIEWSLEPIGLEDGAEPIMELYIEEGTEWDEGRGINIHYSSLNGTGVSSWRVNAAVGENTWSAEYTFNVTELPENMPTFLDVPYEICIEPNQLFDFYRDSISQGDGEIPEGADVEIDIWLGEEIYNQNNFGWFDDGQRFRVAFSREGRYPFEVSMRIGNYRITQTVYFTVGDGVPNDVYIEYYEAANTLYLGRGDVWFADMTLENYIPLFDGEIEWELQYMGHEGEHAAELFIGDSWDMNRCANIHARQTSDNPGVVYYRLVARIRGEEVASRDITVFVENLPEDLPTALDMGNIPTDIQLNVGDSYHFDTEGIDFADGVVPENALTFYDAWYLDQGIEYQDDFSFEYINCGIDGFTLDVTFNNPGRYRFVVIKAIGNYYVEQEICITVGEIDLENVYLNFDGPSMTYFTNTGYQWVGSWSVENFLIFGRDHVEWKLERIADENSPEAVAKLLVADIWEDRRGANIHLEETGDATGSETYRIAMLVNGQEIASEEFTVNVVERPDDLPTGIDYDGVIRIERGESYSFYYDQLNVADGNIPEGIEPRWEVQGTEYLPNMNWHEDGSGFTAEFHEDGVYEYAITLRLGNYYLEKMVYIIVGSGFGDEVYVNWYPNGNTLYAIPGNVHGIGAAYLENYPQFEGDAIHWDIEVLEGANLCDVYIPDDHWDEGRGVNLHFADFTGETGTLRYKLSVSTEFGYYEEREFCWNIVETPEDLPVELAYGPYNYEVSVGEVCRFDISQIGFGEGYVDEAASIYQDVILDDFRHEYGEEGRVVYIYFDEPGEYTFTAIGGINNYMIYDEVTVRVNNDVTSYQDFDELYYGDMPLEDDVWVGNMMLNEYVLSDGEELYWDIGCVWRPDGIGVDMYIVEDPSKPGIVNFYVRNIDQTEVKITFWVTLSTSAGYSTSRYFTFNIREMNVEDLPTELYVGETTRYLTEGEEYRIYYSEFSTNGTMPEDAYFFIDGAAELPFERYFEGTDVGECLFMVPEEGEYTVWAQMVFSNYVITTPITLMVSK